MFNVLWVLISVAVHVVEKTAMFCRMLQRKKPSLWKSHDPLCHQSSWLFTESRPHTFCDVLNWTVDQRKGVDQGLLTFLIAVRICAGRRHWLSVWQNCRTLVVACETYWRLLVVGICVVAQSCELKRVISHFHRKLACQDVGVCGTDFGVFTRLHLPFWYEAEVYRTVCRFQSVSSLILKFICLLPLSSVSFSV